MQAYEGLSQFSLKWEMFERGGGLAERNKEKKTQEASDFVIFTEPPCCRPCLDYRDCRGFQRKMKLQAEHTGKGLYAAVPAGFGSLSLNSETARWGKCPSLIILVETLF